MCKHAKINDIDLSRSKSSDWTIRTFLSIFAASLGFCKVFRTAVSFFRNETWRNAAASAAEEVIEGVGGASDFTQT